MKPQWTRPQLVILAHGKPDEQVLLSCKYTGIGGPGVGRRRGCVRRNGSICSTITSS